MCNLLQVDDIISSKVDGKSIMLSTFKSGTQFTYRPCRIGSATITQINLPSRWVTKLRAAIERDPKSRSVTQRIAAKHKLYSSDLLWTRSQRVRTSCTKLYIRHFDMSICRGCVVHTFDFSWTGCTTYSTTFCTTSPQQIKASGMSASISWPTSSPISHHSVCSVITASHCSQAWRLKRGSRLYITRTSHAERAVDHSHEISTFQHSSEFIMPRYTGIIHSRLWWVVYIVSSGPRTLYAVARSKQHTALQ